MRQAIIVLLILPFFFCRAYAEELPRQALNAFDAGRMKSGLNEEELEISGALDSDSYDAGSALSRLWHVLFEMLRANLRKELGFALRLLTLIFLCGSARAACPVDKIGGLIEICAVCAAAALLVGNVHSLTSQTTNALYRLSDYSRAALPVVYTAAAASGAVNSAAARYAASVLAFDVIMCLSQRAVIPLIYLSLSLSLTNAVFPNPILAAVEHFAKWMAKTAMAAASLAFTAYLGMSAVITGSVDAAAIKTARSVISGALPVVGGMISDASSAVLSAAGVVRSCTGAFGLVSVCAICAGPFALLSVKSLVLKAVAAAAESVQIPRLQKLFSGVGNAAAMLLGLLGSCAVMLFLSFAVGMKAVTA